MGAFSFFFFFPHQGEAGGGLRKPKWLNLKDLPAESVVHGPALPEGLLKCRLPRCPQTYQIRTCILIRFFAHCHVRSAASERGGREVWNAWENAQVPPLPGDGEQHKYSTLCKRVTGKLVIQRRRGSLRNKSTNKKKHTHTHSCIDKSGPQAMPKVRRTSLSPEDA